MALNEEKIKTIMRRYEEVVASMSDLAVAGDAERYMKLSKELGELSPKAELIKALEHSREEMEEALELMGSGDKEMEDLASEQYAEAKARTEELEKKLLSELAEKDIRDERSVIMEIRAGTGGEEAALFAAELLKMYRGYAARKGYTVNIIDSNETELGGYKELIFEVEGRGAYSRLKFESGVHRVQRVPVTESGGRIQTSAVTVAVLPQAESTDITIDPKDLRIDRYRASGAGGQHINRTDSAIRITHIPTGLVVQCQDERSQYKNKDKAMAVLQSRLWDMERTRQKDELDSERRSQVGTGDRSEKIRTYNFHQGRVTDHRVKLTLYRLEEVLAGDLDEIIDALTLDLAARKETEDQD
ncbi:MAG: peptide chain release factor 1 [Clostridiales bacterium]|nr:peptide chain release factor 1 [Clostridiales bacterium]